MEQDVAVRNEPTSEVDQSKIQHHTQPEHITSGSSAMDSLVLLCCKDALRLYRLKSVVQV